jgi:hypothetical protein
VPNKKLKESMIRFIGKKAMRIYSLPVDSSLIGSRKLIKPNFENGHGPFDPQDQASPPCMASQISSWYLTFYLYFCILQFAILCFQSHPVTVCGSGSVKVAGFGLELIEFYMGFA